MDIKLGLPPTTDIYVTRAQLANHMYDMVSANPETHLRNMKEWATSLVAAGRKISAIKLVRYFTGAGLKQAKDYCDGLVW